MDALRIYLRFISMRLVENLTRETLMNTNFLDWPGQILRLLRLSGKAIKFRVSESVQTLYAEGDSSFA